VLRHFLEKLGLDQDFCRKFTNWLEKWTATERGIYHNHGIPQGPISSGLVSEVVLGHFDELKVKNLNFRYFRYVDDIRLFAKSEHDLRRLLVSLDLMSKDIGLFPQSGKIGIHQVQDIENELKTVSNPSESAISATFIDQQRLFDRIRTLTPRYRVSNSTRFKYLLAHATPSAKLTGRLWRILENHPELYRSVCSYLGRYQKLPKIPAGKLIESVRSNALYQAVRAEFVRAGDGRLAPAQDRAMAKLVKKSWSARGMHPDLQVAVGRFLMRTGNLSASQIAYACKVAPSWWARASLIGAIGVKHLGKNTVTQIINLGVLDLGKDAALAAAWKGFRENHVPPGNRRGWNKSAELLMREVGLIQRSTAAYCGIKHALKKLDERIPACNWKTFFGDRYSQAELQAVETVAASGVNITNFVNLLDVFNDLLLGALFQRDGTIGNYSLGSIGSALSSRHCRLAKKFPRTFDLAQEVHERRYESMASHPLIKRSGKPTKRIKYWFLAKAKRLLRDSVSELLRSGYC
jgi:hypothetical protein